MSNINVGSIEGENDITTRGRNIEGSNSSGKDLSVVCKEQAHLLTPKSCHDDEDELEDRKT